jgi:geranylgeranyl diphosphate synthase type I
MGELLWRENKLFHDDVADQAQLRRGRPALHHLLGAGRAGEELAVVVGDSRL